MRVPQSLLRRLAARCERVMASRAPDFVIGAQPRPYMLRWWVIPRNPFFNIYLHRVLRSDDDRALHDHPWVNMTLVVAGGYHEHSIAAGGIHSRTPRRAGEIKLRPASAAHRLDVDAPATTLFFTGPRLREWGFHCPEAGWRHWRLFTGVGPDGGDEDPRKGLIGRGCD